MAGRLHLKYFKTLLWLPQSKFKIWIRSDQWLLSYKKYSKCYVLTSGYQDIELFIFLCRLPLEVVFHWS